MLSTFTYDPNTGNVATVTVPVLGTVAYSYDAVGQLVGIERPGSNTVAFDRDDNGNVTVLTTPSAVDHSFTYDGADRNDTYTTPAVANNQYTYGYDLDGRLTSITYPSGAIVSSTIQNGLRTGVTRPTDTFAVTHVPNSPKPSQVSRNTGAETLGYTYDGPFVLSETSSGTLSAVVSQTYNNNFDIASVTYAGGPEYITYDNDGLLASASGFTINREVSPGVPNATGFPEYVTDGTLTVTPTFNGYGELASIEYDVGGNTVFAWSAERNDAGLIFEKTETTGGVSHTSAFGYDALGRLESVAVDSTTTEQYAYDANGNRTYDRSDLDGNYGRTYDPADDEDHILSVGPLLYTYSPDGFLETKANTSTIEAAYTYNLGGELTQVSLPDKTVEYVHDPVGRRIAKKVDTIVTEKYLWAGRTTLLAVYNGDDTLRQRFVYAGGRLPIAMEQGVDTYYLAYDQVGSLRVVFDQTGDIVKEIEYDTYGNIVGDTNPTFKVPIGFAGGLYDPDTGLTRFGFRDYDPELGRWTAKDPIGFGGGDTNLYGYCFGNPVSIVDPLGLLGVYPGAYDDGMAAYNSVVDIVSTPFAQGFWDSLQDNSYAVFHPFAPDAWERSSLGQAWEMRDRYPVESYGALGGAAVASGAAAIAAGRMAWGLIVGGAEITMGRNWRIAPFGNRTGHPTGRLPHYHRRGPIQPTGEPPPGQGINRHRPWDSKPSDTSWRCRF